jgi:hypothetical protein
VDYFVNLLSMIFGNHSLVATVKFGDSIEITRTSSFILADYVEQALLLEIVSPDADSPDVSMATPVIGTVNGQGGRLVTCCHYYGILMLLIGLLDTTPTFDNSFPVCIT